MKRILLATLKKGSRFYNNNGLLGVSYNAVFKLRGGENFPKIRHQKIEEFKRKSARKLIDDILKDDDISEDYKKPFYSVRDEGWLDNYPGENEQRKLNTLRDSVIAKCKYPIYSKIKGKIPYAILAPATFAELTRLASYRLAGLSSAPLTISALIGFSMPCAVTFSMAEMYLPDKFKFPCKCIKWGGGFIFYGVSNSVDYLTADLEKKCFGTKMPIDAPQLMGTLPTMSDIENLKSLSDSFLEKS
jgi:hypothetical protein